MLQAMAMSRASFSLSSTTCRDGRTVVVDAVMSILLELEKIPP